MSSTVMIAGMIAARLSRALARGSPPRVAEAERVLRQQYRVRPWQIAQLPDAERGRLVGTARVLHRTLEAPLTGRPCLYYCAAVESIGRSGATELIIEREGVELTLEDPSGSAVIDAMHASVALVFDHREERDRTAEPSPAQRALLQRHGRAFRGTRLRFVEAVLPIGERVTVVGVGVRRPGVQSSVESDYRSMAPPQLRVLASEATPLLLSSHRVR